MTDNVREGAESSLRALAGDHARLVDDQWTAIEAIVTQRRRVLVVQRTGWGKSAVYFIATALLRARGAGPTVIVSPLLALMRNQIEAAERAGIHAATINSSNLEEWNRVHADVASGKVDALLVSPERLNNPDFRDRVLPELAAVAGLLVIDEAHCISDWGHDFRPDYRRIRTLLLDLPDGMPVLATTATANQRVTSDVAEQLGVSRDRSREDVLVLRGNLDRSSLHLAVLDLPDHQHRLAWLADHLRDLEGSGIIYTLTVSRARHVADHLRAAGYVVASYSGQTEQAERLAAEDDLLNNRVKALVATSALGMGFDKPDLGFVIHFGAPPSPIAYYQQVGRAGRALSRATVLLLPAGEDREVWDYFASVAFPSEDVVRRTLAALEEREAPMSVAALETTVDVRRTRLEMMLKVLDVDGAVRRVAGGWEATGQPWVYDRERYARVAETRRNEQQAMLAYLSTQTCRMAFLREQLDDPGSEACARCDNCAGVAVPGDVSAASLEAAARTLGQPGVTFEPRKQWPPNLELLGLDLRGKIPAEERAETGRAVAHVTDLGLGQELRRVLHRGAGDSQLPVPLRDPVMRVLDSWEFPTRPAGIVLLGSRRRPQLVSHFAEGVSRYLDLPLVASVVPARGASKDGPVNSAQRLRAVHDRFVLERRQDFDRAPVLLVDDCTESGWTLAVVARMLRQAGASSVYPFVLAVDQ